MAVVAAEEEQGQEQMQFEQAGPLHINSLQVRRAQRLLPGFVARLCMPY